MKKLLFLLFINHYSLLITNAQWVQMPNGMGNVTVYSLAANTNTIFAGADYPGNGVYKSTNNGTNWTQTLLIQYEAVLSLAVNGNNIFAGTIWEDEEFRYWGHVFLSTNNGTSWTLTLGGIGGLLPVTALAVNGNNVFAGTAWGYVLQSTNNGANWTLSGTFGEDATVLSLAVNGNNVFAATVGEGVYLSINNGTTWTQTPLNNVNVFSLAINGNNIFAGTGWTTPNGVYLSTNNGTSWTQTPLSNQWIRSLAVNGNNIFAGTDGNGVYVSTNNGTGWIQRNEGLGNLSVQALCLSNNFIFAGTEGNSVYRRPLGELVGIQPISGQLPAHFTLEQNYPNPFNPTTRIKFEIPNSKTETNSNTEIRIYDAVGREIETLVNEHLNPGTYEVDWDGTNHPSGVYYYKLTSGDYTETKKMILIK